MKKTMIALLVVAMLAAFTCQCLASVGDLTIRETAVFSDAAMTKPIGALPAGTAVVVRSHENYADVYVNGKVVYISNDDLLTRNITSTYAATLEKGVKVYQRATTDADSYKLKSSGTVDLCVINGDWALVRTTGSMGLYAYVQVSDLSDIHSK